LHAVPKVSPHGLIVLDNSERPSYRTIREQARALGWSESTYFGPGPYVPQFWATTFWSKGEGPRERSTQTSGRA
jgi:hypothetical protein